MSQASARPSSGDTQEAAVSGVPRGGALLASRLSWGQRVAFLGCSVGIGVFSAFNNYTLTLWLTAFTSSYLVLGLLGNSRTFEGAIVSPLAGAWSDTVWLGWLGRRRPFILIGGLLSAALLAFTPTLSRYALPPGPDWLPADLARLATVIPTVLIFTVTFNAMDDIYRALLVDVTTPDERNGLSALMVALEMAGQVGILVVGFLFWADGVPDIAFVVTGVLMAVAILVTVAGVPEPDPAAWSADREAAADERGEAPGLAAVIVQYRAACVLGLVMFFYWSGVNAVMPLVSVYVRDILHGTIGQAQLLPGLMLLGTLAMALPVGHLSDRFGKRRVMGTGAALVGLAALTGLVIQTPAQGIVTFLMAGVGTSAVIVLAVPLLADLVPKRHMGAATGALAASGSVAAPVASLAAGALSDWFGPRAIFALLAVMVSVALALLPFTRAAVVSAAGGEAAPVPGASLLPSRKGISDAGPSL